MKTLVWVEHDNASLADATLAAVTAAGKLGEVHLLVAGSGCRAVADQAAKSPASARSTSPTMKPMPMHWPKTLPRWWPS